MARKANNSKPQKVSTLDDACPVDVQENDVVVEDSSPEAVKDHATAESTADGGEEKEADDEEGIWDVVRVIPTAEERIVCRHENCKVQAVAVWASSDDLHDEWPLCEECQLLEFGGWPEGVDPIERACDASDPATFVTPVSQEKEQEAGVGVIQCYIDKPDSATSIPSNLATDAPQSDETLHSKLGGDVESHIDSGNIASRVSSTGAGSIPASSVCSAGCSPAASPLPTKSPMSQASQDDRSEHQEGGDEEAEDSDDEEEEQFDLKEILSVEKIQTNQIVCSGGNEGCTLLACSVWVSSVNTKKWYYCVDCQERDFDGWPELEEFPISHMSQTHMQLIVTKCSRKRAPTMPSLPSTPPSGGVDGDHHAFSPQSKANTHFVTPPPYFLAAVKGGDKDSNVAVAKSNREVAAKKVTPATGGRVAQNGKATVSASAVATHKKWQNEAERLGSKGTRIIIDRKVAKKVIFDAVYDSFCPTNISDLYMNLKAVIPSPVLSACLHEMSMDENEDGTLFADSDDDDEDNAAHPIAPMKKKDDKDNSAAEKDPYGGSLKFKAGKNSSTNLWYVDYTKFKDMDWEERQQLTTKFADVKAEVEGLNTTLSRTREYAQQLLSEPTNDKLDGLLNESEKSATELEGKVQEARKLKVNENDKKNIKKSITKMTKYWRERRKVVFEFLVALEENTDGQVTMKKCLAGDGQIALDSDEAVAKAAVAYSKDKRIREIKNGLPMGSQKRRKLAVDNKLSQDGSSSLADENFAAVLLNSQGAVERVYVMD